MARVVIFDVGIFDVSIFGDVDLIVFYIFIKKYRYITDVG